jgi:hypothetical protein
MYFTNFRGKGTGVYFYIIAVHGRLTMDVGPSVDGAVHQFMEYAHLWIVMDPEMMDPLVR